MKRYVITLALALCTLVPAYTSAQGVIINGQGTATLTWQRPTMNTDGSALAASEITSYGVFMGPQSRFSSGTTLRAGCTATPASLSSTACYSGASTIVGTLLTTPVTIALTQNARIHFALAAMKTGGAISAYSNEAFKDFVLQVNAPPGAPNITNVAVSVTCTTNDPAVVSTSPHGAISTRAGISASPSAVASRAI